MCHRYAVPREGAVSGGVYRGLAPTATIVPALRAFGNGSSGQGLCHKRRPFTQRTLEIFKHALGGCPLGWRRKLGSGWAGDSGGRLHHGWGRWFRDGFRNRSGRRPGERFGSTRVRGGRWRLGTGHDWWLRDWHDWWLGHMGCGRHGNRRGNRRSWWDNNWLHWWHRTGNRWWFDHGRGRRPNDGREHGRLRWPGLRLLRSMHFLNHVPEPEFTQKRM